MVHIMHSGLRAKLTSDRIMKTNSVGKYWLRSSDQDWIVANDLFENKHYTYALFFAHLSIEKLLKAIFSYKFKETAPFSHNLVYLSEKADLNLSNEHLDLLEEITDFNLEARYPDDKFSFYKKCTLSYTQIKLGQIEGLRAWLLHKIRSED